MDLPIVRSEYRNGMYGITAFLLPRFVLEVKMVIEMIREMITSLCFILKIFRSM